MHTRKSISSFLLFARFSQERVLLVTFLKGNLLPFFHRSLIIFCYRYSLPAIQLCMIKHKLLVVHFLQKKYTFSPEKFYILSYLHNI